MRSISRWRALVPQSRRALPQVIHIRHAAYSSSSSSENATTEFDKAVESLPSLPEELQNFLQSITVPDSPGNEIEKKGKGKGKAKGKGKGFKNMQGQSMKPAGAEVEQKAKANPENTTYGTITTKWLKALKDVRRYKKDQVPRLAHGLEKVLSSSGVHWLRDPDTKEYHFDEYLENVPKVKDFAFDRIGGFVPSSEDKRFVAQARKASCKYTGSTSSLTGILVQIYLLLSQEKNINISSLSADFADAPRFFTPGQRIPTSVILHYQDGVYTTDYDSSRDEDKEGVILLPLGTLLEKFLTLPQDQFSKFLKSHTKGDHPKLRDVHRYARFGNFLMRSQLDCRHDSLPGTGVFDLKTRAISQIRHDVYNYTSYTNCFLDALTGRRGTFEEEYYDMIRSAFLEYSFQARIGNMDGIMVAYHNVARIFGFQYISLREMDSCLYSDANVGHDVFLRCVYLMERLYDEIAKCFPKKSVQCTFEKRKQHVRVWVEPLEHKDATTDPPVVELALSLTHIVDGRMVKKPRLSGTAKWWIKYEIERIDEPQSEIIARRDVAYARQMSIATSLPDPKDTSEQSLGEAVVEAPHGEVLVEVQHKSDS